MECRLEVHPDMQFDGTFTVDGVTREQVWLALSDPLMIKRSLPGCQFLVEVTDPDGVDFDQLARNAPEIDPPTVPHANLEDIRDRSFEQGGEYAARIEYSLGSVNPTFDTVVTVDRREFPEMGGSATGNATDSSFKSDSQIILRDREESVDVEWRAEANVFGRIAQMGQRMITPVANRLVGQFFQRVERQLRTDDGGIAQGTDQSGERT